jgi:hypothetical protein
MIIYLRVFMALQPRRTTSSFSPLLDPHIYSVCVLISKKLFWWNLLHEISFKQIVSSVYYAPKWEIKI